MYVVTIASTKGGVGKSTLAAVIIDGFLRTNASVRVVDFDKQRSVKKWATPIAERNPNLKYSEIETIPNGEFKDYYNALLDVIEDETDWVIIDTAGADDHRQLAALAASELVLCPSGPVEDELMGVQKTVEYLKAALEMISEDTDALDMLRVIYRKPIGFPDSNMNAMREVLFSHFGVVDEIHHAGAMTSFLGQKQTTDEIIKDMLANNKNPKSIEKVQVASDRIAASLEESLNG